MAAGVNRFTWDLQFPPITSFPGMILWGATTSGPTALAGTYQVRLTVDGRSQTQPLTVKKHPLHDVSDSDMQAQFDLARQIRDKASEANEMVIAIRELKKQMEDRAKQDATLKTAFDAFRTKLTAVEEEIYQTEGRPPAGG